MAAVIPIVLTGPESTGKSELGKVLSAHFSIPYVPEYARWYLENLGKHYDYRRLQRLARLHKSYQQSQLPAAGPVLLDTDLINYYLWSQVVFGSVDPWLKHALEAEGHHRYLLTYPDLPWQEDPLRENPHNRKPLFKHHQNLIERLGRPYRIITGQGEDRKDKAIKAVGALLRL
jgi:nicotinamide riboside kinase